MKLTLLAVVAAICGAALGVVVVVLLGLDPGRHPGVAGSASDAELAATRAEIRALADRLAWIERNMESMESLARVEPSRETYRTLPKVDVPPNDSASPAHATITAFDARRLLAEYVASFADGGQGSDFFRMAVAAYAWQLRRELHAIAVDRDAPDALRLQIIAMFSGGSFRGDGATLDALLEVLRQGGWEQGATASLSVLAKIGDRRTAELIEAVTPGLTPLRVRAAAWAAIAELCGGDADIVLLRLFEREREPEGRQLMIALFRGTDLAATLRAYELASRMEQVVRLDAATRIGRFRDERFGALIDDWLSYETDEHVRARLLAAQEQRRQIPGWHELQATGAPNVANVTNDDQRAWATAAPDGGREWLELTYGSAQLANRVTVFETCVAGAVIAIDVMEEGGTWRTVWSGVDPLTACGPFEVRFATTRAPVRKVRVTLDTTRGRGWNEIDAVELSGPDGSQWATHAVASSRYGENFGNAISGDVFRNAAEVEAKWLDELKARGR